MTEYGRFYSRNPTMFDLHGSLKKVSILQFRQKLSTLTSNGGLFDYASSFMDTRNVSVNNIYQCNEEYSYTNGRCSVNSSRAHGKPIILAHT